MTGEEQRESLSRKRRRGRGVAASGAPVTIHRKAPAFSPCPLLFPAAGSPSLPFVRLRCGVKVLICHQSVRVWDDPAAACDDRRGPGMEHGFGGRAGAGAIGSAGSLGLRVGQAVCSSASMLFMSVGVEFFGYTAFCFLVTIMGLVIPWSGTLAMIDVYSILMGCHLRVPGVMALVVVGDTVLSILSFAAACSSAAVIDLLLQFHGSHCSPRFCGRYQLSATMAFLSWFLTAASALFNFWFIASRR